jgi:hypothetical protein
MKSKSLNRKFTALIVVSMLEIKFTMERTFQKLLLNVLVVVSNH